MVSSPKSISVIIPVYNVSAYLSACLDSILAQTFTDIEIIAVNDGSTDNSYEILDEYARRDARIRVFNQSNEGVSAVRNKALSYATGEYIVYVDADDYLAPTMLELLYRRAKKVDADVVICNFKYVRNGEPVPSTSVRLGARFQAKECFSVADIDYSGIKRWTPFVVVWNKLFKRSFAMEHIHFPPKLRFEDTPAMFDALYHAKRISVIDEALYFYRVNIEGQFTSIRDGRVSDIVEITRIIFKQSREYECVSYKNLVRNCALSGLLSRFKTQPYRLKREYYEKMRELVSSLRKNGEITSGCLSRIHCKIWLLLAFSFNWYFIFAMLLAIIAPFKYVEKNVRHITRYIRHGIVGAP